LSSLAARARRASRAVGTVLAHRPALRRPPPSRGRSALSRLAAALSRFAAALSRLAAALGSPAIPRVRLPLPTLGAARVSGAAVPAGAPGSARRLPLVTGGGCAAPGPAFAGTTGLAARLVVRRGFEAASALLRHRYRPLSSSGCSPSSLPGSDARARVFSVSA